MDIGDGSTGNHDWTIQCMVDSVMAPATHLTAPGGLDRWPHVCMALQSDCTQHGGTGMHTYGATSDRPQCWLFRATINNRSFTEGILVSRQAGSTKKAPCGKRRGLLLV